MSFRFAVFKVIILLALFERHLATNIQPMSSFTNCVYQCCLCSVHDGGTACTTFCLWGLQWRASFSFVKLLDPTTMLIFNDESVSAVSYPWMVKVVSQKEKTKGQMSLIILLCSSQNNKKNPVFVQYPVLVIISSADFTSAFHSKRKH